MRYDLTRFKSGTDRIERTYEPADFGAPTEDFRIVAPVRLVAQLTKHGVRFSLRGHLRTTLELACSRCLEAFEVPVDATLDLTFVPAPEPPKPVVAIAAPARPKKAPRHGHDDVDINGSEIAADDIGLSEYAGDEIDLGQMMREQFYLALPMKPLCQPDCKGLCPVCGKNRNRETCSCESTWVDPRFEVLRNLKKNEKV
ncbi:MAG: DUF177 domain-containing protein [Acidobacteria bacterium]|nr:MAG: DUF177 domain-containing protein [Acidobacteriota bacterium]